ncbi:DUF2484 family protein [Pseudooctadecabacter jejudonensis]|uniref:DUF2484 family protein n=1 Tax=Pseudooctadecabacter jejudonensis TaxID=1391910 RepID=A0A1Y5RLH8_9RHOB|nr:DUF2484 family protein [Pseudooctadecabacter jejudonensis]SLN19862.1 hypothetical protein PSJ8397_00721 [Pseudooctadecabacter jejudonensis]
MTVAMISIACGFGWIILANVLALLPSRDNHWTRAYVLIAVGLPLLAWITYSNGVIVGFAFLIGGMSVLRWPVVYLGRWLRRVAGSTHGEARK